MHGIYEVHASLVSSTLSLTSNLKASPYFGSYMFVAFLQCITRKTPSSTLCVIQHNSLVPVMNFSSFFDA